MRPVISATEAERRLLIIFPRGAFDTVMSSRLAGAAVAALIYVDAIWTEDAATTFWGRPSMVTWMSEAMRARMDDSSRVAWRTAAAKNSEKVVALMESWSVSPTTSYADNSRETLRDETFRRWLEIGAVRQRSGVPKTSSKGRWALEPHFADLFDPALKDVATRAAAWRESHLSPSAKIRVQFALEGDEAKHAVTVALPSRSDTRRLEAGRASLILKGVMEDWAPSRLRKPYVITISEPGNKVFIPDQALLATLGLSIDTSDLLPDAIIADVDDDVLFWFIEVANSDGVIDEGRQAKLLSWAQQQSIDPAQCRFLTAFLSRGDTAARKRLKDLAPNSFAFFAAEPGHELAWYPL
ncbi:hypothetical protein LQ938_11590 [Microbacterium sp. cx-55]|uniref:BsuBI/PstI family type II restriction endonuclease n=1 Tax=Microbacterium sp. cx-55 TaxID=2875948 RepID=UPI001CBC4FD9|nr:BsuBI/PstI family type II restriction endonuclease [Microbacterium sp. cx-55]MBZ4488083.1 hypothetical protein [Microbacterium sp. cx-55]UGB34509.1 hypothetical protein LQ938_11590 [Microbacterium sp. cx-55]